jgi:putative hydrolase of the HAD superfamily
MVNTSGISAILFDFDGTLRFSEPSAIDTFHRFAAELGVDVTLERELAARRWIAEYWANSDELLLDLEIYGNYPENGDFWKHHSEKHLTRLGAVSSDTKALAEAVTSRMQAEYESEDFVPADVHRELMALQQAGYRLGVVSNRQLGFWDLVHQLGLADLFEIVLAAGEVGIWKPDPGLLLHATSTMGVDPNRTVYVGDNYFADVVCARAAGMRQVLVDPFSLFPDPGCAVITSVAELRPVLVTLEAEQASIPAR